MKTSTLISIITGAAIIVAVAYSTKALAVTIPPELEKIPESTVRKIFIAGQFSATKQIAELCAGKRSKQITLRIPTGEVHLKCSTDDPI